MVETKDIETGATESTPLVGSGSINDADNEPPPLGDIPEQTNKERIVFGAAAVGFATSMASMLVEDNPSVYLSGTIGAGIAPYAAFQQQKLTEVEALRETNQRMEEEVNILKEENERLQGAIKDLEGSVDNLREMEETLANVKAMEGKSIDILEDQLETSQQILKDMEKNLKATILQNLISIVFESDIDGDNKMSDAELDEFMARMENIGGVQVKEELFRKKIIDSGRSLNAVMDVIRNLLDEEVPPEERIFDVDDVEGF